ncbi:MAG: quinolinate synthase NadA [Desulfovibrionaceae bacterium]|nr:quinolinate synthase NadA [Desulfovibrionaceae bacterium]
MQDLKEIEAKIAALKERLGPRVRIVGHHYQRDDVVRFCDHVGDSLQLIQRVAGMEAEYIIFCGVSFMGETAALMARDDQKVLVPVRQSSSRIVGMPTAAQINSVLSELRARGLDFLPMVYVNSTNELKAVCGKNGGAMCTSSNLRRMLQWAFRRSQHVLFLPDRNLARNTALQMGMSEDQWHVLDVDGNGMLNPDAQPLNRHLLIWPGCCGIHEAYTPHMINEMRYAHNGCRITVHSEASPEVVALADAAGPTSFLIQDAQEAARSGRTSMLVIGTELNLVNRLRLKYRNSCTIIPLLDDPSQRDDTAIVQPADLLAALESIESGTPAAIEPPAEGKSNAARCVLRMLDACGEA